MKKLLFFIVVAYFGIFVGTASAMPAPRTAKIFYFSQIEKKGGGIDVATIYRKFSCYKGEEEYCKINKPSDDKIYLGAGYSTDNFSKLNPYSAIPLIKFSYNSDRWKLLEINNESQVLVNKNDDRKSIYFTGQKFSLNDFYGSDLSLDSAVEFAKKDPKNYQTIFGKIKPGYKIEKHGDFVYVINEEDKEGAKYLYSLIPTQIIFKGNFISQTDRDDFVQILDSIQYSKQYLGEIAKDTFIYDVWEPKLFFETQDVDKWAKYAGMSLAERQAASYSENCDLTWPDYLKIKEDKNCLKQAANTSTCGKLFYIEDPNLDIGRSWSGFDINKFYSGFNCDNQLESMLVGGANKTLVDINDSRVSSINSDFFNIISNCVKSDGDLKVQDIATQDVQVYSRFTPLIIRTGNVTADTWGNDAFVREDLNSKKMINFKDRVFYPYFRLFVYRITDADKYLKKPAKCLSFSHKNNLVYLGYVGNFAVLAEFIPDDNKAVNKYLVQPFFSGLYGIKFYDSDFYPMKGASFSEQPSDYGVNRGYYNSAGYYSFEHLDWFDEVTKFNKDRAGSYSVFFDKDSIDKMVAEATSPDYASFPEDIPDDVVSLIARQFDDPVNRGADKFVGQSNACEKDNSLCLDYGEPWDYMSNSGTLNSVMANYYLLVDFIKIALVSSLLFALGFYIFYLRLAGFKFRYFWLVFILGILTYAGVRYLSRTLDAEWQLYLLKILWVIFDFVVLKGFFWNNSFKKRFIILFILLFIVRYLSMVFLMQVL